MQELFQALQRRSSELSPQDVRRMLRALWQEKEIWQAAGACERPFPRFVALLESLCELGHIRWESTHVEFTPTGEAALERWQIDRSPPLLGVPCPCCAIGPAPLNNLRQKFSEIAQHRPPPLAQFEQGYLTAESVLRRVAWLDRCGDLTQKQIALLGDDDLLSIALALTGRPAHIVVFEIDTRLVEFITGQAQQAQWPLQAHVHDLRLPLPEEFLERFDLFITDPLETVEGFLLFVEQGLSLLKRGPGQAGYFGLTKIEASPEKWRLFEQRLVQQHELFISDVVRDFGLYENWPYLTETVGPKLGAPERPWYRSAFFRVETLKNFEPPRLRPSGGEVDIYCDHDSIVKALPRRYDAGTNPGTPSHLRSLGRRSPSAR